MNCLNRWPVSVGMSAVEASRCLLLPEQGMFTQGPVMGCRYKYTPADLQKKIDNRRDRGAVGNLVMEQARLTNLCTNAQSMGNTEEAER